jgi:hypothetical protein
MEFPRADLSRRDSNESSQVRSAWENKKARTVPKGTIDLVVLHSHCRIICRRAKGLHRFAAAAAIFWAFAADRGLLLSPLLCKSCDVSRLLHGYLVLQLDGKGCCQPGDEWTKVLGATGAPLGQVLHQRLAPVRGAPIEECH